MTEPIQSLADALAMSDDIHDLPVFSTRTMNQAMAEIRRLRACIEALEAEVAIARGTLAKPEEEAVSHVEHNLPPSAPPHDE